MRRKTWILLCSIPLLLIAGDFVYWRIAAERLRNGYRAWVAEQSAAGWQIAASEASISGWPGSAVVAVPTLSLRHQGPEIPGQIAAAAAEVTLSVPLFVPTALRISVGGPLHVRVGNGPDLILSSAVNAVSVPLVASEQRTVVAEAQQLRMEPAAGTWRTTIGSLNTRAEIDIAADGTAPPVTFTVDADAVGLPAAMKWPLGPTIASLSLNGEVNGKLPQPTDVAKWAKAWRDGGGSLQIDHLAVTWGPLRLTGGATLALDDELQPMGSGNGRIVGYAAALDQLAAGGVLTKSAATAAKAVLSLLADTSGDDEPGAVEVPLTLQYRTLSMRQVPLVRLPEVDWQSR